MHGRGAFAMVYEDPGALERLGVEGAVPEQGFARLKVDEGRGHVGCVVEWVKMLRGEAHTVRTSGQDCRETVAVAEAAYRSVETGQHVNLPIAPQPWVSRT